MFEERELQGRIEAIGKRIREVEAMADPTLKTAVRDLVQSPDFHGADRERIVAMVQDWAGVIERFAGDELISSLLLWDGLHPAPFGDRVTRALENIPPDVRLHGGDVEWLGIDNGVVRIRLQGSGRMKSALETAIYNAAPDLNELVIEEPPPPSAFVPLTTLQGYHHGP